MKIKELIAKLQKFPQEKEVVFYSRYSGEDAELDKICEGFEEIFIDLKVPSLQEEYEEQCLLSARLSMSQF